MIKLYTIIGTIGAALVALIGVWFKGKSAGKSQELNRQLTNAFKEQKNVEKLKAKHANDSVGTAREFLRKRSVNR